MKRAKLSLEPGRDIRRRPPTGFPAADADEGSPAGQPKGGKAAGDPPVDAPESRGSPRQSKGGAASRRPGPAPARRGRRRASEGGPGSVLGGLDRAKVMKALLAIGVAAVSIVVLKRRVF